MTSPAGSLDDVTVVVCPQGAALHRSHRHVARDHLHLHLLRHPQRAQVGSITNQGQFHGPSPPLRPLSPRPALYPCRTVPSHTHVLKNPHLSAQQCPASCRGIPNLVLTYPHLFHRVPQTRTSPARCTPNTMVEHCQLGSQTSPIQFPQPMSGQVNLVQYFPVAFDLPTLRPKIHV